MVFGFTCLGLSLLFIIAYAVGARKIDRAIGPPFLMTFLTLLLGGIFSLVFSEIVGMLVMALVIVAYLIRMFRK